MALKLANRRQIATTITLHQCISSHHHSASVHQFPPVPSASGCISFQQFPVHQTASVSSSSQCIRLHQFPPVPSASDCISSHQFPPKSSV
eukprot:364451-Chlamydomonas_euryale.AAC.4